MFYALSWFVVLSLLALWSLGAWALHAMAALGGGPYRRPGGRLRVTQGLRVPDWLAPWMPPNSLPRWSRWPLPSGPPSKPCWDGHPRWRVGCRSRSG